MLAKIKKLLSWRKPVMISDLTGQSTKRREEKNIYFKKDEAGYYGLRGLVEKYYRVKITSIISEVDGCIESEATLSVERSEISKSEYEKAIKNPS